ncbi:MAG TPA: hypothetical protein VE913_23120 [Longimicrobium sp.]|nr:hypothetical protein [Longimicrobium sp.]
MKIASVVWSAWGVALLCGCSRPAAEAPGAAAEEPAASAAAPAAPETAPAAPACLVTEGGIGAMKLGMTIAEARRAMPTARFERSSDGDGVALISVAVGRDTLMSAYAGESDAESAIDDTKRVEHIETFSPLCGTADGVRPGALVTDAEKVLGGVRTITLSEIESREFVQFERQPAWASIRLDGTGIFADGSTETTKYQPGAKILSIAVASRPEG